MNYSINYQTAVKSSLILLIVIGLAITFAALFTVEDQYAAVSPQVEIVNITHYIDQQKQVSIEDLLINDSIISQATTNPTSFSHNPHTIWLKIIVSNPLNHAYSWVLNTTNNHLLSASIYELITSKNKPAYELIYNHGNPRVQNLPYFTSSLASNISFKANETKTLYIQYHSLMSTHLHINFDTMDKAVKNNFQDKAALEIEVAVLFTLIFINFLFYFSLRKIQYLYYCLQELFIIFLFLVNAGYSMQFIHPDNAGYIPIAIAVIILLTTAVSMMFIDAFLDIKSLSAKFSRLPFIYVSLGFIFIALTMIPFTQTIMLQYLNPFFLFSSIVFSFILGCIAVYNKKYYAIPFCLAWVALTFFISFTTVSVMDIYHIESINHFYPTYIGYLIEGALLSLAMGLQISDLRKQNESWTHKLINIYKERSIEAQDLQQAFKEKRNAIKEKLKKSTHLASASHDINHNLFLIKLNVESLKNETNQEEIKSTQSSLKYLQDITDDILTASKREVEKPIGLINIKELFESLCGSLNSIATKKNIQLRCRASDIYLDGSSVILKRILENLIRNALQHTQRGGVLLAIRNLSTYYKIQVFDSGSGIAKEKLNNIQNAFTQGDTTNSGHGMGLYIVSNLCQQAGYQLNISSRVGKGSIFTIKIKKQ